MRYVSEGKFDYIVEREYERLKTNTDTGMYVFMDDEKENYIDDYFNDNLRIELYEEILWETAEKNISKKYKIKYKEYNKK